MIEHPVLLALALGLLGFVEPCVVGAHMLFLGAQRERSIGRRLSAVCVFVLARTLVTGGFGGAIVTLGQRLIEVQTAAWLVFGVFYLALGVAMIAGVDKVLATRINFAPQRWRAASHPAIQGLAFGLNIPACAAPILFGLIATASAGGSVAEGFLMMAVFALALSLPLLPLTVAPHLATQLDRLADWLRVRRWLLGSVFVLLGLWSAWFGLFVDPVNWSGA